ncbi:lipid II flippase family protein [Luteolibacter sp. AS25]|uniref:lipid II flippase family protein n=1 Tax=Luteolibacter sp. AS25 TaxID=3135776 RepID=UPI00398A821B
MDPQLIFLCILIGGIHFISTLSYGVRIAGIRTGRLALSLALFNVLVLFSRSSNSILAPLLSKRIETGFVLSQIPPAMDFRILLLSATIATCFAAFIIPSFQRLAVVSIGSYERKRSMLSLLTSIFGSTFWNALWRSLSMPRRENLVFFYKIRGVSIKIFIMNAIGIGLISTGVFCSLYAGTLEPELRLTASNLSASVNMCGTLILFGVVDPYFSFMSDRVSGGEQSESEFRQAVAAMTSSRILGTLLGQVILIPGATIIVWIATRI